MTDETEVRELSHRVTMRPKWVPVVYNGLPIASVDCEPGVVGRACHMSNRLQTLGRKHLHLTIADAYPITDLDISKRDLRYVLDHARCLVAQRFGFFGGKYLTENTYGLGVYGNTLIVHLKRFHDPVTFKAWVRAWKATVGEKAEVDFHYRHDMKAMNSLPYFEDQRGRFTFSSEDQISDAIRDHYTKGDFEAVGSECARSWRKWADTAHVTTGHVFEPLPEDDHLTMVETLFRA